MIIQYNRTMLPVDLTTGLIAYYPFLGNANDESGNSLNGTVTGATLTTGVDDVANSAYYFGNAVSNRIVVADNDLLSFTSGTQDTALCFSVWMKATTINRLNPILTKSGVNLWEYYLGITSDNKIILRLYRPSFIQYLDVISNNAVIVANTWYNVVATYDGQETINSFKLYLNNILLKTLSKNVNYTSMSNTSSTLFIGNGYSLNSNFAGILDNIRIYRDRILNQAEINNIYNNKL